MTTLFDNVTAFQNEIEQICAACGRNSADVRIVPATKTVAVDVLNELPACGITEIGENRVQELLQKYDAVHGVKWHVIGQLQSNKVKYIIDKVSMIESVDRVSLADEIERLAAKANLVMPVLIEVNVARHPLHGGVAPEDTQAFASLLLEKYPHIKLCGLMAVLPVEGAEAAAKEMKELADRLKELCPTACELSMGMSVDYEIAIKNGATIVRPGRKLFGERNYTR